MTRRNPKPKPNLIKWRFATVASVITMVFTVLLGRAAYIQVIDPDRLQREGDMRSLRTTSTQVQRGIISDRHGQPLAISVPVQAVWADPKVIHQKGSLKDLRAWQALSDVLSIEVEKLRGKVQNPKKRFVYLQRQVSPAMAQYVDQLGLPGVYLKPESRRFYPTGEISAHVIGFTNIDDKGQEGIERTYDDWLTGTPGERKVRKDRHGRVIEDIAIVKQAQQAKDIELSIDQRLQSIAYQALKKIVQLNNATSGSAVVIDITTGEVLAMVNSPSFNPNNRGQFQSFRVRNRAITDTFEPGSTVKPLVVASALINEVVAPDEVIDTSPGWMRVGGRRVADHRNYGEMDLAKILQKSSNVGVSKLALALSPEKLKDTFYDVGLGNDTGIGLIGETSGMLPERRRWSDFELATMSFGYGITANTLQLAQAYAILANGGISYPLSIIKLDKQPQGEQVIPKEVAFRVLNMLEGVTQPGGTGLQARVDGYRVAGKTGTSRKAVAGGYGDDYVAVFAGVAPVSNPKLAIAVTVNEPKGDRYYGGDVAAPVFAEVMDGSLQLLNVIPDDKDVRLTRVSKPEAAQ
ncbi:penicillin-binding transpeptidase domain-containing protein [Motilimonas pumila]|uniref:Peptidoglycan D,D-transpeptidase FtsI n=1 Tax=Motilimonas pumila TaxID=2303987 RepID=A0A418YI25_9GAMM|nr:penicillin-binding transpeptidase domain-containing protein [Motilimonas pumila]RJG50030.1 peptidoglycan glycosyltransferase FtsI [Motilimonas pumila]